jgi:hypothetical protein
MIRTVAYHLATFWLVIVPATIIFLSLASAYEGAVRARRAVA